MEQKTELTQKLGGKHTHHFPTGKSHIETPMLEGLRPRVSLTPESAKSGPWRVQQTQQNKITMVPMCPLKCYAENENSNAIILEGLYRCGGFMNG